MATYRNLKELGDAILQYDDKVILADLEYIVYPEYLSCPHSANEAIFTRLNLNKHTFCDKHYGYRSEEGGWPECNPGDYEALTRVVKALFKIIEKESSVKEWIPNKGDTVYVKPLEQCKKEGYRIFSATESYYGKTLKVRDIDLNDKSVLLTHGTGILWFDLRCVAPKESVQEETHVKEKVYIPKEGEIVYLRPLEECEGLQVSEYLKPYHGTELEVRAATDSLVGLYLPDKSNWHIVSIDAITPAKSSTSTKESSSDSPKFKRGDRVYLRPYNECKVEGLVLNGTEEEAYDREYIIQTYDDNDDTVELDGMWYYAKACRPIKTPKFKVGDTVLIKSYKECKKDGRTGSGNLVAPMMEYCDKYAIITKVCETSTPTYKLNIDDGRFHWRNTYFEKVELQTFNIKVDAPICEAPVTYTTNNIIIEDSHKETKIECSSEFKFTINKPKKVFF